MEYSIGITKIMGKGLFVTIFICLTHWLYAQSDVTLKNKHLTNPRYISAFAASAGICDSVHSLPQQDSICYTIQICTREYSIHDPFIGSNSKIQVIPMGDVYRYIFSLYPTLAAARHDLKQVRRIYPDAFIREYKDGKLGMAIDLNINRIRTNN